MASVAIGCCLTDRSNAPLKFPATLLYALPHLTALLGHAVGYVLGLIGGFREEGAGWRLWVEDDGADLPPDYEERSKNSFGRMLVAALASRVNAEVTYTVAKGTRVDVFCGVAAEPATWLTKEVARQQHATLPPAPLDLRARPSGTPFSITAQTASSWSPNRPATGMPARSSPLQLVYSLHRRAIGLMCLF